MIKWKYNNDNSTIFFADETKEFCGNKIMIARSRASESPSLSEWLVEWYNHDELKFQKYFEAANLKEAKATAIVFIKDFISQHDKWWWNRKLEFIQWTSEE